MTEPYFNLPNIQEVYDQFIFEEYDFLSYFCSTRVSTTIGVDRVMLTYALSCSRSSDSTWSAILGLGIAES